MDTFVNRFHNLGGSTVSEHKRNFNIYLKDLTSSQIPPTTILAAIHPKHRQEVIFHIKLLAEFNQQTQLLDLLTQGDRIISKVVLRYAQLTPIFAAMSPKDFIEKICPDLSYVTRIAVINKCLTALRDVNIAQDYFTAIRTTYGIRTATPILVACSENFVIHTVRKNKVQFTQRALIKLHKSFPGFLQIYFKTESEHFGNCSILAQYLSVRDVRTFRELLQYGMPKIGKRGFTNFLKNYKTDVIESPDKHSFVIPKIVARMLTREELITFFSNIFPKSIDHFYFGEKYYTYLKLFPLKDRFTIFCDTFRKLYGFDVLASDVAISVGFLELLPVEDRMKFKEIEEHVEYKSADIAIEILKNRINLTSDINTRSELAKSLVMTCKINNDTRALLEVLKYFTARHKNDIQTIRAAFVDALSSSFDLEKLGGEYWKLINDLVLIFEVNDECYYNRSAMMEKYLHYLLLNGLEYDGTLKKLFKINGVYGINIFNQHSEFAKKCLLRYPEFIDELFLDRDERIKARTLFLSAITNWNCSHRKDQISYYDYPEFIKNILDIKSDDENRYYYRNVVKDIILFKPLSVEQSKVRDEILEKQLIEGEGFLYDEIIVWLVKYRPDLIEKNGKYFISRAVPQYEISKMHYLKVFGVLKDVCLKTLDDPKSDSYDVCAALTLLAYDDDIFKYIDKYKPSDDCVVDIHDEEMAKMLRIQKCILKLLKCLSKTEKGIETVLHYCKKDYLRYALEPLYFTLYHAREKTIQAPIDVLLTRAVSVRKHTVYLGTILGTTTNIYNVLKTTGETEKNRSVKKFIFARTYQSFLADPCDEFYQLLVKHLDLLDLADRESMCTLLRFHKIPKQYYAGFIQIVWRHIQRYDGNREFDLLTHFSTDITKELSPEFCKELIQHSLFHEKNGNHYHTVDIVQTYLMCDSDELQSRVNFIMGLLNTYADGDEGDCLKKGKIVAKIYEIYDRFCMALMDTHKKPVFSRLINALINSLPELKLPCDKFEFELLVNFTKFFIGMETDYIPRLSRYFCNQLRELIAREGAEVSMLYRGFVEVALERAFRVLDMDRPDSYLEMIEALLQTDDNTHTRILCIRLLPKSKSKDPRKVEQLQAVVRRIKEGCSPVVHVFMLRYLREL